MAAPTFVRDSVGVTDAGGAWTATSAAPFAAGNLLIVQVLQDGTNASSPTITSVTNAENLAGTDGVLTYIGEFDVGSAVAASQHLWIGRALSTSAMVITGANAGTDDIYVLIYEFQDVNTGTTLAAVIENGTAGATTTSVGTSATASDADVTTLGADRLALNFMAINDDNAIFNFTGETGGDWTVAAEYRTATGTDGCVALHMAVMPSAGTISGGSGSITNSDAWGMVGFALIGTTPSTPVPRHGFVNFQDPGVFCKAHQALRRWRHGASGILVPDGWAVQDPGVV